MSEGATAEARRAGLQSAAAQCKSRVARGGEMSMPVRGGAVPTDAARVLHRHVETFGTAVDVDAAAPWRF